MELPRPCRAGVSDGQRVAKGENFRNRPSISRCRYEVPDECSDQQSPIGEATAGLGRTLMDLVRLAPTSNLQSSRTIS
jgi:hypothetical protein